MHYCRMNKLESAIIFAVEKHAGAVRKGSELPYIIHPLEALTIASGITDDQEVLAAVVLHDVVEDTQTTLEDIESIFGKRIADLVASHTEDKMPGIPASESWEHRKQTTIQSLQNASLDEKIIVLSDKLSNIRAKSRDVARDGDDMWKKFNQKDKKMHEWYYRSITDALSELSETLAYQELVHLIDRVFDESGLPEEQPEIPGDYPSPADLIREDRER